MVIISIRCGFGTKKEAVEFFQFMQEQHDLTADLRASWVLSEINCLWLLSRGSGSHLFSNKDEQIAMVNFIHEVTERWFRHLAHPRPVLANVL